GRMGVELRIESNIVVLNVFGRAELSRQGKSWSDRVREAAEAIGSPVLLLCKVEPGVDLPPVALGAGAREALSIVPLLRAVAMVAAEEREQAMLRATAVAIRPHYPLRLFADEDEARAWLLQFAPT